MKTTPKCEGFRKFLNTHHCCHAITSISTTCTTITTRGDMGVILLLLTLFNLCTVDPRENNLPKHALMQLVTYVSLLPLDMDFNLLNSLEKPSVCQMIHLYLIFKNISSIWGTFPHCPSSFQPLTSMLCRWKTVIRKPVVCTLMCWCVQQLE